MEVVAGAIPENGEDNRKERKHLTNVEVMTICHRRQRKDAVICM